MTASLPVPHDADPDEPDRGRPRAPVVRIPRPPLPVPEVPAGLEIDVPEKPPLPPAVRTEDILIPPRPPLPPQPETDAETDSGTESVVESDADTDAAVEPDTVDAVPDTVDADDTIVEPDVVEPDVVEPEPEAARAESAPQPDAEPLLVLEELVEAPADLIVPTSAPASTVLELTGVTKTFGGTRAVEGLDLVVPTGSFYGLVGPNGAGKTTTLSMIAGLLRADRGEIRVGGVDAAANPLAAKQLMGVLPDRLRTFDRLTGRQLLYYYGVLRGLPPATVESRTADLARAFDLTESLGRVVSDYSAGMVKKVMLAGALIHSPRLLVLDEPFEAVDPVSSAIILDILKTYVAHGGSVILSSHGMEFVERVCTRVAVMVAGQVLAEGTVDEVRGELTLEQRFVELAGGLSDVEGLEWLHTYSD
ncbi:ABC transporter ATP-binding protein [Microbacterium hominis]|uniref:ABC transporter ATP-binding protein n=1 Tax=Microbacterium hominis TaxID=162426 RepID=UPI0020B8F8C9|nr:ATP-binding cassette domain-containing protein [Microbacterium hominis]